MGLSSVDWNCDQKIEKINLVKANINRNNTYDDCNNNQYYLLKSRNDWDRLVYDGGAIGGFAPGEELAMETVIDENFENVVSGSDLVVSAGISDSYVFQISNPTASTISYSLEGSSEKGWIEVSEMPSQITLQPNENISIEIPINIPATATLDEKDTLTITVNNQNLDLSESSEFSVSVNKESPNSACLPPSSGDWIIKQDCTIESNIKAPANVFIKNNSVLKISDKARLDVDLKNHFLKVEKGSGLLIKEGGKVY